MAVPPPRRRSRRSILEVLVEGVMISGVFQRYFFAEVLRRADVAQAVADGRSLPGFRALASDPGAEAERGLEAKASIASQPSLFTNRSIGSSLNANKESVIAALLPTQID